MKSLTFERLDLSPKPGLILLPETNEGRVMFEIVLVEGLPEGARLPAYNCIVVDLYSGAFKAIIAELNLVWVLQYLKAITYHVLVFSGHYHV